MNSNLKLLSKASIFFFCLFLANINRVQSDCSKSSTRPVKEYIIDLDKPARERFVETSLDFKQQIISYIKVNKDGLRIPPKIVKLVELFAANIDSFFPYPFNEELKGIADALDIGLGDVVIANMIYDLTA